MTETTARAALIAEAAEYGGYCYFCGDLMPNLAAALADAEIELAVARAIVNESIRGDRVIRQKMDDAEREMDLTKLQLAVAKSVSGNAVRTLAQIASLDISATKSIEDLVAPWRRIDV